MHVCMHLLFCASCMRSGAATCLYGPCTHARSIACVHKQRGKATIIMGYCLLCKNAGCTNALLLLLGAVLTGFCACCSRYGLLLLASRLLCVAAWPDAPEEIMRVTCLPPAQSRRSRLQEEVNVDVAPLTPRSKQGCAPLLAANRPPPATRRCNIVHLKPYRSI